LATEAPKARRRQPDHDPRRASTVSTQDVARELRLFAAEVVMRPLALSSFLFIALLLPTLSSAQITYRPTPAPQITAASATWRINGEPIFFAGSYYYPAGPTVFFDGQLMARVGDYLTVPVYADTTLEAHSKIFIPIGGAVMKAYERRRAGALAGTVGSTTPNFPVQVSTETLRTDAGVGNPTGEPLRVPEDPRPIGTTGVTGTSSVATAPPIVAPTAVESVPRPTRSTGISVEYDGALWVADGPAVSFSPERFDPIGAHRGFPVYRAKGGNPDTIHVTVVADGPIAPYRRR
jgi:hypothetical protein